MVGQGRDKGMDGSTSGKPLHFDQPQEKLF